MLLRTHETCVRLCTLNTVSTHTADRSGVWGLVRCRLRAGRAAHRIQDARHASAARSCRRLPPRTTHTLCGCIHKFKRSVVPQTVVWSLYTRDRAALAARTDTRACCTRGRAGPVTDCSDARSLSAQFLCSTDPACLNGCSSGLGRNTRPHRGECFRPRQAAQHSSNGRPICGLCCTKEWIAFNPAIDCIPANAVVAHPNDATEACRGCLPLVPVYTD